MRDLAAHLVIRDTRLDLAAGMFVKPLAARLEREQAALAASDFEDLVNRVRTGPPRWSAMAVPAIDEAANRMEFFVHHEDVRRAREGWEPRELATEDAAVLWDRVGKIGKLLLRRCPVGVLVRPTDGPAAGRTSRLRSGDRDITLVGPVGEIVLAKYGRITSGLAIEGADDDAAAFLAFPR